MAWYLVQGAYTPEAWAAQISNPGPRLKQVAEMLAPTGLTFEHYWYSYGEYDFVIIAQAAGNVETVSAILAAVSGGALKSLKTTPLVTAEETMEALKKAGDLQYQTPSAS